MRPFLRPNRATALRIVPDIIARRSDGRPRHSDPFDAFAEKLPSLGYARFRMWWTQTVTEMKVCEPHAAPTCATVLSAALVEGVLTFVVKHARERGVGPMQSGTFKDPPQRWSIDDLVKSAAAGGDAAILSPALKGQADILIRARQRIHAGRMIADFPTALPDLRPDEAQASKQTAAQVVRAVLDWLDRFPPN